MAGPQRRLGSSQGKRGVFSQLTTLPAGLCLTGQLRSRNGVADLQQAEVSGAILVKFAR